MINKVRPGTVTVLPRLGLHNTREYEMETRHSDTHLPVYGIGDAPAFLAKSRRDPSNVHLPFFRKAVTCRILNK
jgi:hypothetical protein